MRWCLFKYLQNKEKKMRNSREERMKYGIIYFLSWIHLFLVVILFSTSFLSYSYSSTAATAADASSPPPSYMFVCMYIIHLHFRHHLCWLHIILSSYYIFFPFQSIAVSLSLYLLHIWMGSQVSQPASHRHTYIQTNTKWNVNENY